jgi:hypothetical protein
MSMRGGPSNPLIAIDSLAGIEASLTPHLPLNLRWLPRIPRPTVRELKPYQLIHRTRRATISMNSILRVIELALIYGH